MQNYDEDEIIGQLQSPATRRAAFSKVVAHYSEPLYWHIRKMVMSHDDADDLLQNTFMKAWMNNEYFRGEASVTTCLDRLACTQRLHVLDKQRQQMNVSIEEGDGFLVEKLEADEWFCGDEAEKQLHQAILKLPEKQRLVFNLRYFQEMRYEDMSSILGTSVGALKASYHLAAKKIEDYLTEKV